jgi:hypothetical protein
MRVRQCLSSNHFLELYTKNALLKAGAKLISREIDGKRLSTSIQWQLFPRVIELDVCAVSGNNLIVCECKTNKITVNVIDQKLAQVWYLLSAFERAKGVKPDIDLYFLTTAEIEGNIPRTDYSTSTNIRIHFVEGTEMPKLLNVFQDDIVRSSHQ